MHGRGPKSKKGNGYDNRQNESAGDNGELMQQRGGRYGTPYVQSEKRTSEGRYCLRAYVSGRES